MKPTKWALRCACALLGITLLVGGAAAAGTQGSESNPLVTLSYLNDTLLPALLKQVDEKVAAKADELEREAAVEKTVFVTVELTAGQQVKLSAGAQLLPRSGKLSCADALVDVTEGATWNGEGTGLVINHLYLATGDGQTLTAAASATLLIQGDYTVEG